MDEKKMRTTDQDRVEVNKHMKSWFMFRRSLIWRREYKGHVPDTAIAAVNSSRRGKETTYFGRAVLSKEVIVPGEWKF